MMTKRRTKKETAGGFEGINPAFVPLSQ